MKICLSTAAALLIFSAAMQAQTVNPSATHSQLTPAPSTALAASADQNYGKLPLSFEANQGQTDPQVKFTSRGKGYSLFLTDSAAVLSLTKEESPSGKAEPKTSVAKPPAAAFKTDIVRMELAGASHDLRVEGAEKLPGVANYLMGNDPAKWHSHVPTYAKVKYTGVYPGVDLVYYGNQRQLEYDFIVAPGADAKPVKLHFDGAKKLKLNAAGDLSVSATNGKIIFHKPVIYQMKDGQREPVDGQFNLLAKNTVGFELGTYDHARELVIDPTFSLAYATYLGASEPAAQSGDNPRAIAVDQQGNAYIAGYTESLKFPTTPGAFQPTEPSRYDYYISAFVTKLNPTGSALVYSTYLGGNDKPTGESAGNSDGAYAIAVDGQGDAFVAGFAGSVDFPVTAGAFQTVHPATGSSSFVTQLKPDGSGLVYSTLFDAGVVAIAVDPTGHAFITGSTFDADFPVTSGAFQPKLRAKGHDGNAFVTKFSPDGSSLVYSTYLGGTVDLSYLCTEDQGTAIAIDASDEAYVTGMACSHDFPVTPGAFQTVRVDKPTSGGTSGFVTKLSSDGSSLVYSTYLNAKSYVDCSGIAVDKSLNAYVIGFTSSNSYPVTEGAYQVKPAGSFPSFVTKLNPTGSALVYSTYFGTQGLTGIAVGPSGDAYLSRYGGEHTQFQWLDSTGSRLRYASPIRSAVASAVAIDGSGNAYVTGIVDDAEIPATSGAFQQTNPNPTGVTGFVMKFALSNATATTVVSSENPEPSGQNVTLTAHVAPVAGGGVPAGVVNFSYRNSDPVNVELDSSGNASYTTPYLPVGSNPITAVYLPPPGGAYFTSTTTFVQNTTGQVAAPIFNPLGGTHTAPFHTELLTTSPGATIYYTTNGTTPTIHSAQYSSILPITAPSTTIKAIAVASGDTPSPVSTAVFTINPAAVATTTSLQTSLNPSVEGQSITLTATVTAASGPTPTGSVTFKHGDTEVGSVPLVDGVAKLTTSSLPPNTYNFIAVYTGSATDNSSTTPTTLVQRVNP